MHLLKRALFIVLLFTSVFSNVTAQTWQKILAMPGGLTPFKEPYIIDEYQGTIYLAANLEGNIFDLYGPNSTNYVQGFALMRFDSQGNKLSTQYIYNISLYDMHVDSKGILISGAYVHADQIDTVVSVSYTQVVTEAYVGRYNFDGSLKWEYKAQLMPGHVDICRTARTLTDGRIVALGRSREKVNYYNVPQYFILLDSTGTELTRKICSYSSYSSNIVETPAGFTLFYYDLSNHGALAWLNSNGDSLTSVSGYIGGGANFAEHFERWSHGYLLPGGEQVDDLGVVAWTKPNTRLSAAGNWQFYQTSAANPPMTGGTNYRTSIAKLDGAGDTLWQKYYGGNVKNTPLDVISRQDQGVIALGKINDTYLNGLILIKADSAGNTSGALDTIALYDLYGTRINTNSISAAISTHGLFFSESEINGIAGDTLGGFVAPVSNPAHPRTIFSSGWWIGGTNNQGELHLKGVEYCTNMVEFLPGPLGYSAQDQHKWNYIWHVTKSDIDAVKADLLDNCQIDNPVPQAILDWPGKGNTEARGANGQSFEVLNDAAPYYDLNRNGRYDPRNGDYPLIMGDEMYWFVFNDSIVGESGGKPLGMEVQASVFAYANPADTGLYQTVFTQLRFVNKSGNIYNNVYIGNFVDIELGCYFDDLVGCDTSRNLFYGYQYRGADSTCSTGYGTNSPVQMVRFLDQDLHSFITYNNDFTVIGNPVKPSDYYSFLKGQWKDSTCITPDDCNGYGGNGCTNYMFPSDPNRGPFPNYWSGGSCGNAPADRRVLGSIGPMTFLPNQTITVTTQYTYAFTTQDSAQQLYPSLTQALALADSVANYYYTKAVPNDSLYCDTGVPDIGNEPEVLLYPNPTTGTVILSGLNGSSRISVYDITGQLLQENVVSANTTSLELAGYKAGLYLVKVQQGSQVIVKRLVKE